MIVDELHDVLEARKALAIAEARKLKCATEGDPVTGYAHSLLEVAEAEADAEEAELAYGYALETFWRHVEQIAEAEAKYVARQGAE